MGNIRAVQQHQSSPPRERQHLDVGIARIAERQYGVISRGQLMALGATAAAIRHRLEAKRLHEVYPGTYAVGHRRINGHGRYMAAVLACGDGAVLSHRSAADLLDLRPTSSPVIDVTIPHGRRRRPPGITVHRTRALHPAEFGSCDGIPCTSPARTLVDLAGIVRAESLERAIERAQILRVYDAVALSAALERARGRRGAGTLRRLLATLPDEPPPTRSRLERRFLGLVREAGLPPPIVNGPVEGEEVDFHWPDRRLIVETDGRETHDTPIAFERDRARDLKLELAGWHVIRLSWRQIAGDRERVIATLVRLVQRNPRSG